MKRRNGKPLNNPQDFEQYAVDILRSNGGFIIVNEYRYIAHKTLLRALAHATKAKLVRRKKSSKPHSAVYYLVASVASKQLTESERKLNVSR